MVDLDLDTSVADASLLRLRAGTASRWHSPEITVTAALFAKFQQLIYRETGIWLSESKTALLCGRLARRLHALHLSSLKDYYELVVQPDQRDERMLMIDAITTNETRFFREPRHFQFLGTTIFPTWRKLADRGLRSRNIRIWSAGCSSGEEAYSLAMVLAENFPESDGWAPRILATDISTRVLATAHEGIYRIASSTDIPRELLQKYMLKGYAGHEGKMKVIRAIRQMVEFKRLNLAEDSYPLTETFDTIFCRNVLIYFDAASKRRVIEKLIRHLSPQGLFFIGHTENLHAVTRGLRSVVPTVYLQTNGQSSFEEAV